MNATANGSAFAEPSSIAKAQRQVTISYLEIPSALFRWFWLALLVILLTALALGRSENLYHPSG
jgi:hypothetical protein